MTLSAGAGVCAKSPKAATRAAAKPTGFQPANMRIIIPLVFAPVHHGPPARRPPLSGYYVVLYPLITRRNAFDVADAYWVAGFEPGLTGGDLPRKGKPHFFENSGQKFLKTAKTMSFHLLLTHRPPPWTNPPPFSGWNLF